MSSTIENLDRAKNLAFEQIEMFPEVLKTVLPIVYTNDLNLQKWCLNFLIESYDNKDNKLSEDVLKNLSVQIIDPLLFLIKIQDVVVIQKSTHLLALTYKYIFLNVLENGTNPTSQTAWQKISDLKQEIMRNFQTSFPLIPLNKQTDAMRSLSCKIQTILLISVILQIQLPAPPKDPRLRRNRRAEPLDVSITMIPMNHPVLNNRLEAEGMALLDTLFNLLNDEALVITPIFTTIELVIVKLLKKRPNHVYKKLTALLLLYDSKLKKRSKFEDNDIKVKLIGRFNDRFNKVVISFMLNQKLITDSTLQLRLSKKNSLLMLKNDVLKKRGILNDSDDESDAKRRKTEPMVLESDDLFYNSSPISKDLRYSSLYSLINPKDQVNDVDLSNISQDILANMVLIALQKIDRSRLIEGLTVVSERYREVIMRPRDGVKIEFDTGMKAENDEDEVEDGAGNFDDIDELNGVTYDLPIPKPMTFDEKEQHLKRITQNFIKLSNKDVKSEEKLDNSQIDLVSVAIPSWNKESWLILLTRLASRGLQTMEEMEEPEKNSSENLNENESQGKQKETFAKRQLSNTIRDAIFKYFSEDIRGRVGIVIDWLNEEWYSEIIKAKSGTSETPVYDEWAGKVLDTVILFLESGDRNIFIRLLSDLPFLSESLIWKIKSLCLDPTRYKIGFQSLQFLCLYRPPVKECSINLLKELYLEFKDKDDQDFLKEVVSLLKKFAPEANLV